MKNKKNRFFLNVLFAILASMSSACTKEFLEIKRDKSQVIPQSLEDYQAIFENNRMNSFSSHILAEVGSDDYYISSEQWNGLANIVQKNGYIWGDEVYQGESSEDWNLGYERILYANFVLEGVTEVSETLLNKPLRDEVLGSAYFFRGANFFLLAQLFCKQYDTSTANTDLGLPLRTTSNVNHNYQRATLQATYDQIIHDLERAVELLPERQLINTRPYLGAALAMLANVYLQMGDYQSAYNYTDTALRFAPILLNYNNVDLSVNYPFPLYGQGNHEIIFFSQANVTITLNSRLNVDSMLYASYEKHDLRKQAFFFVNSDRTVFKGSYSGNASNKFTGITSAELFLIRAECSVRLGKNFEAVDNLNKLRVNRIDERYFEPISYSLGKDVLLDLVLSERRRELIYRGKRWGDLKRLNADPFRSKVLVRILNNTRYELPINSLKWVWPIPPDAVILGGIQQNKR